MRFTAVIISLLISGVLLLAGPTQTASAQEVESQSTTETSEKPQPKKAKPKRVKVRPGDSLSKLANKHKSTYRRIYYANKKIKHPDLIFPGQKLSIPKKSQKLKKRSLPTDAQVPAKSAAAPTQRARRAVSLPAVSSADAGVWDRIAACESGGNWSINTGNGYYGGLQFSLSSWRGVGGSGYPHQASKSEQIARAKILQSRQGWGAWPACTAKLGLR